MKNYRLTLKLHNRVLIWVLKIWCWLMSASFWLPNSTLPVNNDTFWKWKAGWVWIKHCMLIKAANLSLWCKSDELSNVLPTLGFTIIHGNTSFIQGELFHMRKFTRVVNYTLIHAKTSIFMGKIKNKVVYIFCCMLQTTSTYLPLRISSR